VLHREVMKVWQLADPRLSVSVRWPDKP